MNVLRVLEAGGVSKQVRALANRTVAMPFEAIDVPTRWYNSPPAFVPIWSNGSSGASHGLWIHDVASVKNCFVVYDMEMACATEIARSDEQFLAYTVIQALTDADGVTDEVEIFQFESVGESLQPRETVFETGVQ